MYAAEGLGVAPAVVVGGGIKVLGSVFGGAKAKDAQRLKHIAAMADAAQQGDAAALADLIHQSTSSATATGKAYAMQRLAEVRAVLAEAQTGARAVPSSTGPGTGPAPLVPPMAVAGMSPWVMGAGLLGAVWVATRKRGR